jgi:hypothetical protein
LSPVRKTLSGSAVAGAGSQNGTLHRNKLLTVTSKIMLLDEIPRIGHITGSA